MKKIGMTTQVLIAAVLGVLAGAFFGDLVMPLGFIGDVFLRLLRMGIVVLVLGHVIEAIGSIKPKEFGKLGSKIFFIFAFTSLLGAGWGVLMGYIFTPGIGVDTANLHYLGAAGGFEVQAAAAEELTAGLISTIVNFIPINIIAAMTSANIMQILVFGVLFGIAVALVSEQQKDKRLIELLSLFNKSVVKMITKVMFIAPIGVFALLSTTIGGMGTQVILPLARFLLVYAVASIIFFLAWALFNCLYCRVNFIQLLKNVSRITLVALATGSSAVTMPVAMQDTEQKVGVSKRLTSLIFPLGLTINSTGAAMHMALATMTVAQIYGIVYGPTELVYIILFTTLASAANAVVPGAGIVSLIIVAQEMGFPMEIVPLFAGVEILIGMCRVLLNVNGDVFTAMIVAKSEGEFDASIFNADNKNIITIPDEDVSVGGAPVPAFAAAGAAGSLPVLVASAREAPDANDNKWLAVLMRVYDK